MICILYGFPCEIDFSHHKSQNPIQVACDEGVILRQVVRNLIYYGKLYKMHFLAYFALQDTLVKLITLRRVEDHEIHVRFIISQLFSTGGKVGSMRENNFLNVDNIFLPISQDNCSHYRI